MTTLFFFLSLLSPSFTDRLCCLFSLQPLSLGYSLWTLCSHISIFFYLLNHLFDLLSSLLNPFKKLPALPCMSHFISNFDVFLVVSVSVLGAPMCLLSFGDASLSSASTLEHIPSSAVARPRPLVRQQSLQQPLTHQPPPGPNDPPVTSQSLGQLHTGPGGGGPRGGPRGVRGSPAGASRCRGGGAGRSRSNPGSWDHMMEQIRHRGLDVKSFLWVSWGFLLRFSTNVASFAKPKMLKEMLIQVNCGHFSGYIIHVDVCVRCDRF